jgi:hypothetical protein
VVGLVALAIQDPVYLLYVTAPAPVLITCGVAAVVLAIGFVLTAQPVETFDERPSWLVTAGTVLSVVSVPLAVGVFGVFSQLAEIGGRL